MSPRERIKAQALSLGFDAVGFTAPNLSDRTRGGLQEFIAKGHYGDMQWMADKAHLRADPKALWPEVKSIIAVGHNYGPSSDPMEKLAHKDRGVISSYALGNDYHDVIKKKLKNLARWVAEEYGCEVKIFVDTAPVMEKPLAESAGLGWQGKHTCLVSRDFGSWLFLGSIFTTLSLPLEGRADERKSEGCSANRGGGEGLPSAITPLPNPPPQGGKELVGHCGSCTNCIDACPTQAITSCGKLEVGRCIAYLTIEHKGQIPLEFRKAIGNRVYGCDDCLAVCPWNKFASVSKEMAYHARENLESPRLHDLAALDDAAFRQMFSKSPVKRVGRDRFVRNVLVAIGNSGDASLVKTADDLRSDASPLVAEMAAWAVAELAKAPI